MNCVYVSAAGRTYLGSRVTSHKSFHKAVAQEQKSGIALAAWFASMAGAACCQNIMIAKALGHAGVSTGFYLLRTK